jgi:hypothetical protein
VHGHPVERGDRAPTGAAQTVDALLPIDGLVAEPAVRHDDQQSCGTSAGKPEGAVERYVDGLPVIPRVETRSPQGALPGRVMGRTWWPKITLAVSAGTVVWRAARARIHPVEATASVAHHFDPDTSHAMPAAAAGSAPEFGWCG